MIVNADPIIEASLLLAARTRRPAIPAETVEDYLRRGGTIKCIPPATVDDVLNSALRHSGGNRRANERHWKRAKHNATRAA